VEDKAPVVVAVPSAEPAEHRAHHLRQRMSCRASRSSIDFNL
jgi:hypothetical protein